jgi:hypothetical protein
LAYPCLLKKNFRKPNEIRVIGFPPWQASHVQ